MNHKDSLRERFLFCFSVQVWIRMRFGWKEEEWRSNIAQKRAGTSRSSKKRERWDLSARCWHLHRDCVRFLITNTGTTCANHDALIRRWEPNCNSKQLTLTELEAANDPESATSTRRKMSIFSQENGCIFVTSINRFGYATPRTANYFNPFASGFVSFTNKDVQFGQRVALILILE